MFVTTALILPTYDRHDQGKKKFLEKKKSRNGGEDKIKKILTACKDDEFECAALYCISKDRRCDGVHDCSNGRDEHNCGNNSMDFNIFVQVFN